jgi:hypothetical protein
MKIVLGIFLCTWLAVGFLAAGQRGHYGHGVPTSCTEASTTTLTMLSGPLNYQGLNPQVHCRLPRPSA